MYHPAPPRPRKTHITRARTGCFSCRRKRVKCDEAKPACRLCSIGGQQCTYARSFEFRDATTWAAEKVQQSKRRSTNPAAARGGARPVRARSPPSSIPSPSTSGRSPGVATPASDAPAAEEDVAEEEAFANLDDDFVTTTTTATTTWDSHIWQQPAEEASTVPLGFSPPYAGLFFVTGWQDTTALDHFDLFLPGDVPDTSGSGSGARGPGHPTDNASPCSPDIDHHLRRQPDGPRPGSVVADRVYAAHFAVNVCDILPGCNFSWIRERVVDSNSPVRLAALALAAGNMAVKQGTTSNAGNRQPRPLSSSSSDSVPGHASSITTKWVPKRSHITQSINYAVRAIAMAMADPDISPDTRLATLLFLSYYELEVGSVQGMWRSLNTIETTILAAKDELLGLPHGPPLLRAWLHLRARCRIMYGPHRACCVESFRQTALMELEAPVASSAQMVELIAAHAGGLSGRVISSNIMRTADNSKSSAETLKRIRDWWSMIRNVPRKAENEAGTESQDADATEPRSESGTVHDRDDNGASEFDTILDEQQALEEIRTLRRRLERCQPPPGLCLDNVHLPSPPSSGQIAEDLDPIRFSSHDEAMQAAMYALANIFCDEDLLTESISPLPPGEEPTRSPWLDLLIRIAAGVDPSACARRNTYRVGLVSILHCAALRCNDLAAFDFIDYLICAMIDKGAFHEGVHTPLHLSRLANCALRREVASGRLLLMTDSIHVPSSDRDYQLSPDENNGCIIIHGREADGRFFQDYVPLGG